PNFWKKDEILKLDVKLTVTAATDEAITLRLDGGAVLESIDRGYDAQLPGTLRFHRKANAFGRLDRASVGDHLGDHTFTPSGARPGKTPFGIALQLADPKLPSERVSPQAARELAAYMSKD